MSTPERDFVTPLRSVPALAGFCAREAVGRLLFPVLVVVLTALTLALPRLVIFGFGEEARIVRDLGVSTLRTGALLAALLFAAAAAADERARGARALLLARPVSPAALVLGRFAGAVLLLAGLLASLSVALAIALKGLDADPLGTALQAGVAALGEGAALVALGLAAGEALPPGAAVLATLAAFALGGGGAAEGGAGAGRAALGGALAGAGWLALASGIAEWREAGAEGGAR